MPFFKGKGKVNHFITFGILLGSHVQLRTFNPLLRIILPYSTSVLSSQPLEQTVVKNHRFVSSTLPSRFFPVFSSTHTPPMPTQRRNRFRTSLTHQTL